MQGTSLLRSVYTVYVYVSQCKAAPVCTNTCAFLPAHSHFASNTRKKSIHSLPFMHMRMLTHTYMHIRTLTQHARTRVSTQLFFYALAFEPTGPVVHMLFQLSLAVRNWYVCRPRPRAHQMHMQGNQSLNALPRSACMSTHLHILAHTHTHTHEYTCTLSPAHSTQ